jgi:hypothetical protein
MAVLLRCESNFSFSLAYAKFTFSQLPTFPVFWNMFCRPALFRG